MNFEDFEIEEIPYWCRHCHSPAAEVIDLPIPIERESDIVCAVCESCYNDLCNDELESVRQRQLRDEPVADWVSRCNAVSEKYGFGAEHAFCESCWCPQPHDPDCIECSRVNA